MSLFPTLDQFPARSTDQRERHQHDGRFRQASKEHSDLLLARFGIECELLKRVGERDVGVVRVSGTSGGYVREGGRGKKWKKELGEPACTQNEYVDLLGKLRLLLLEGDRCHSEGDGGVRWCFEKGGKKSLSLFHVHPHSYFISESRWVLYQFYKNLRSVADRLIEHSLLNWSLID